MSHKPKKPEWGTPEHDEWLAQLGRNAFIHGHMGAGGADLDKLDASRDGENYDVFPTQSAI